jgi:hypothetical protein
VLLAALAVALATVAVIVPLVLGASSPALKPSKGVPSVNKGAPSAGSPICGQPVLDSPWHYHGPPRTYRTSGHPAGLPTFGAVGTDFPKATRVIVVAAGDNTATANSGAYQVNNTVVYFEPGTHTIQNGMYTGHDSAYVGGYTAAAGKAIINGVNGGTTSGLGGGYLSLSKPSANYTVNDTWEYLTIENYAAAQNSQVMGNVDGGGIDDGDVYKYDTIGPNEYGYSGSSSTPPRAGESSGGGYAIGLGSYNTIEYSCLTRNAQGAFNDGGVGDVITNNEISWNGLGEYPDSGGSGVSPFSCGCSGGGKLFFSVNAEIVNNWIHDNYNAGIWLDTNNTGALISHNYIASNWGVGIVYESSYNAKISNNTLVGNGWASNGPWPAGIAGGDCGYRVSCTVGAGPRGGPGGFPYAAIYLPNSGGYSALSTISIPRTISVPGCSSNCSTTSRYSGHLLIRNNVLSNNFGGITVYTDTNRYPGNIDQDNACNTPLGALNETNNHTYYQQSKVLITNTDARILGSSVATTGGTKTICADYGHNGASDQSANTIQAPSVGMVVYDQNSGRYLGAVASVTSAHAFTLSGSPGNESGAALLLSAHGGCGPADYFGAWRAAPGTLSGSPLAAYRDNCLWGSRNITISGNTFSMNASQVRGCTAAAACGYMMAIAFDPGIPKLMQYWGNYYTQIADASGRLGNVWSNNIYTWAGGGPGHWQFEAGGQGTYVTQAQWLAPPYGQDKGSGFP